MNKKFITYWLHEYKKIHVFDWAYRNYILVHDEYGSFPAKLFSKLQMDIKKYNDLVSGDNEIYYIEKVK